MKLRTTVLKASHALIPSAVISTGHYDFTMSSYNQFKLWCHKVLLKSNQVGGKSFICVIISQSSFLTISVLSITRRMWGINLMI